MKKNQATNLVWRTHTNKLFEEILGSNNSVWVLIQPIKILHNQLREIAKRCSEINDPILNKYMCDITMYSAADPTSPDYDEKLLKKVNKDYAAYIKANNLTS